MREEKNVKGSLELGNECRTADGFVRTAEEEEELFASLEEIRNGDFEDAHELLAELRSKYLRE
jgi:hypothetical protein